MIFDRCRLDTFLALLSILRIVSAENIYAIQHNVHVAPSAVAIQCVRFDIRFFKYDSIIHIETLNDMNQLTDVGQIDLVRVKYADSSNKNWKLENGDLFAHGASKSAVFEAVSGRWDFSIYAACIFNAKPNTRWKWHVSYGCDSSQGSECDEVYCRANPNVPSCKSASKV